MLFALSSEPLPPHGFRFSRLYHGADETTVTLQWQLPLLDEHPASVVDNYIINVLSSATYPEKVVVDSPPFNITLLHNVQYTINLTAQNCAGESNSTTLSIFIGKHHG